MSIGGCDAGGMREIASGRRGRFGFMTAVMLLVALPGCLDRLNGFSLERDAAAALGRSGLVVSGLRCSMYVGTRAGWCEGVATEKAVEGFAVGRGFTEGGRLTTRACPPLSGAKLTRAWTAAPAARTAFDGPHLVMVWMEPARGRLCLELEYRYG